MSRIAEIIGPSGAVHYRRPPNDPLVTEARATLGYSVRIVNLGPSEIDDCPMCGKEKLLRHAIGYCCGFTRDEIGSQSSEYIGHEVGARSVCSECHDNFYGLKEAEGR